MKKNLTLIITLISLVAFIFPQQGEYTRKSVSSLESVWVKSGALKGVSNFDYKTFDKFIDFYVEVERFDYNVLPDGMLNDFRSEANSLSDFSVDALAGVLESTVATKIVDILNDPDVMQARGSALKSESALQSFAATKAKSLGLTTEELATLMNSAYIYLPFITSMVQETEGNDVSLKMNGGLIWWQVKTGDDGSISVEKVLSAETMGMSTVDKSAKNSLTGQPLYNKFTFGNDSWATSPEQYAQNDAMLAFAKNLGVKTKKIDAFKLSAQIAETDGKKYGFPLGFREGVHLDDGFDLVEFSEDAEGNEVANRVGFIRVSKTGDNNEDPSAFTYGKQIMGSKQDIGAVVMERPNLGIDLRVKVGYTTGMNILDEHTTVFDPWALNYLSYYSAWAGDDVSLDDFVNYYNANYALVGGEIGPAISDSVVTSGPTVSLLFSYNLAPIIGMSQTFLNVDVDVTLPASLPAAGATAITTVISPYTSITKKFGGRMNLAVNVGGGIDMLAMTGAQTYGYLYPVTYTYTMGIMAPGVKFGAELGYMLTPELSLNFGARYKLGLPPMSVSYILDDGAGNEYDLSDQFADASDILDYSELNMGGMTFNLGVSYTLSELPINLFGFLDPFKKY